jgi:hypothetical protein
MGLRGTTAGGEVEFNFYARTWGVEGTPEQIEAEQSCLGQFQSPVNLKADFSSLPQLPAELITHIRFPSVANPRILNTGHVQGLQVRLL